MKLLTASLVCFSLLLSGCTVKNAFTRETKISYASIGAMACGGVGALIGGLAGQSMKSSLIGGASGAALCGGIGYYLDQQEEKLRQKLADTGVSVVRDGKNIRLVMPGNIIFNSNDARLIRPFHEVLDSINEVLTEYDKTKIYIHGHTDSTGTEIYNLGLSQQRADSVANYLLFKGVTKDRILAQGFGEQQPIAKNTTKAERRLNRRVEIIIKPR